MRPTAARDNLHARVQPDHYQRQIQLLHDIVPFKTLGLVYEDTEAGRTYAAIDKVAALMPTLISPSSVATHARPASPSPQQPRTF